MPDPLPIRRATAADHDAILALAGRALGWADDERDRAYFRWKHEQNPFGRSPMWVATDGDEVVAFRAFLRWAWRRTDGQVVTAVRAVDTATDPDHRRLGLFRRLTLHGVDELRREGVGFVFNTPNGSSRPGYLQMGWVPAGRPRLWCRPFGVGGLARVVQARRPAEKWSVMATFGSSPEEAFADDAEVEEAFAASRDSGLATDRSPAYLRWRYGFGPLHYRVLRCGTRLREGFAVVRLRRRGAAVEAAVCEWFDPSDELLRQVEGADYLLLAGSGRPPGALPLPGQGPLVTWRSIVEAERPSMDQWALTLGDLELF